MSDDQNKPAAAEPAPAVVEPAPAAEPAPAPASGAAADVAKLKSLFAGYLGGEDRRETLRKLLADD
jgi:hypothetical protein